MENLVSPDLDSCDKIMGKFLLNSAKMFVGSETNGRCVVLSRFTVSMKIFFFPLKTEQKIIEKELQTEIKSTNQPPANCQDMTSSDIQL